jgi:ubiquinone biosynthesis protein
MGARIDPKGVFYQSQKFKVRAMRVIEAIERMIGARPGQKMEINFRAAPLEATVRRAGRHLALGLTAGAAILASGLTAISARVPGWVPITFGVVGALLTLGLLLDLFRERGG